MVSVVLAVLLDAKFKLLGLKLHVMYCERLAGRLHSSAIVPEKSVAVHVICAVPESPERLMVGMVQLTLGGGSAIPESCTCCGLPPALSATFNVAASDPAERLGVNFTLITQLLPAATLVPHGLVCEKSAAFAPEIVMPVPVMLSAAFPVLDSVTGCAADCVPDACGAKVSEVGLRLAIGAGAAMVIWKLPVATLLWESVTCTVKLNVPAADGAPVILPDDERFKPEGRAPDMTDQE